MVRELVATGRPLTVDPKFVVASEVTFTFLFIIQRYSNYMQFCKCGVVTGGVTIGRRICVHVDVTVETGSRGSGALKPCASFSYPIAPKPSSITWYTGERWEVIRRIVLARSVFATLQFRLVSGWCLSNPTDPMLLSAVASDRD